MFLRNRWYVGATAAKIGDKPLNRTILGEPVVFFRESSGAPVALEVLSGRRFLLANVPCGSTLAVRHSKFYVCCWR